MQAAGVPVLGPPLGLSWGASAPVGVSRRPCLKWQPGRRPPSAHIPRLYAYADVISGQSWRAPGATSTRVLLLVMTDARGHPHSTCLLLGSLEWSTVSLATLVSGFYGKARTRGPVQKGGPRPGGGDDARPPTFLGATTPGLAAPSRVSAAHCPFRPQNKSCPAEKKTPEAMVSRRPGGR